MRKLSPFPASSLNCLESPMPVLDALDPMALDTQSPEIFWYGLVQIDIREAKRILSAKKRPPKLKNALIGDLARFVRRPSTEYLADGSIAFTGGPMELDWEHIESPNVDLSVPILLAQLPKDLGGLWPIDGWHRIAKAIEGGSKSLPCYILSAKDSLRVITRPD